MLQGHVFDILSLHVVLLLSCRLLQRYLIHFVILRLSAAFCLGLTLDSGRLVPCVGEHITLRPLFLTATQDAPLVLSLALGYVALVGPWKVAPLHNLVGDWFLVGRPHDSQKGIFVTFFVCRPF